MMKSCIDLSTRSLGRRWTSTGEGPCCPPSAEPVDGSLTSRTLVFIVFRDVDEVGLAEAPLCLRIGGHGLGDERCDPGVLASLDLQIAEVAAIGEGLQFALAHFIACSHGHLCQLSSVSQGTLATT